jgi:hypothetical protein
MTSQNKTQQNFHHQIVKDRFRHGTRLLRLPQARNHMSRWDDCEFLAGRQVMAGQLLIFS